MALMYAAYRKPLTAPLATIPLAYTTVAKKEIAPAVVQTLAVLIPVVYLTATHYYQLIAH